MIGPSTLWTGRSGVRPVVRTSGKRPHWHRNVFVYPNDSVVREHDQEHLPCACLIARHSSSDEPAGGDQSLVNVSGFPVTGRRPAYLHYATWIP